MVELVAYLLWGGALVFLTLVVGSRQGRLAVATMAGTVASWMLAVVIQVAPTIAVSFARSLLTAFREHTNEWQQVAQIFVDELAIGTGGAGGGGTSGVSLATLVNTGPLIDTILQNMVPRGELTPEQGQVAMANLLGLNVALGLQGWWTELVGDIVSLGRFGSAADLPEAMEKSLGLNRLGRLIWRAPVTKAIAEPLTELYNRRYTFKKLTVAEATQLWHRGQLDDAGFLDAAAAAGYNPTRAAQLLVLAQRFYDQQQIRDLQRLLGVPDTFILDLLREQGLTNGRDRTALDIIKAREEEVVLKELAVEARKLYRTGRLTQAQLGSILAEAKYPPNEVGIILATEDLIRAESKQLTVGEIQAALRDNALDPGPARARLRELGYRDEDIDILLTVRGKQPSAGQIIDAVARGRLTPAEGEARLQREGYSAADAALLVSLRGRRLSEGQVLDALRGNLINAGQARADLVVLGFSADEVDILLAFVRRVLSPADVQAAVLRGILTEQEGLVRLEQAGYTPADAAVLIALRRRLLLPGQILDAFEDGFITRQEALGDLQARGFTQDDALVVVRIFELRLTEKQARARQAPPGQPPAPRRQTPPSGGRRGTGGTPPAAPPP